MKKKQKPCLCGSQKSFAACCDSFLKHEALPETAEQLMRSRYSAYAKGKMSYIQNTMCGKAAEGFDLHAAKETAEQTKWVSLKIIDPGRQTKDGDEDEVEFEAWYQEGGQIYSSRERSHFKKIEGKWFYTEGEFIPRP